MNRLWTSLLGVALLAGFCGTASDSLGSGDAPPVSTSAVPTTRSAAGEPIAQSTVPSTTTAPTPLFGAVEYEVIQTLPHDDQAFTQGLEFVGDRLLESTGHRGESTRRWLDPDTGAVEQVVPLDQDLFGEGITELDGRTYQLTYTSEVLLVSDTATLEEIGRVEYRGEGWGLCALDDRFVMSNGQPSLVMRDIDTFEATEFVTVTLNGDPVASINELECVGPQVWANVWSTNTILAINPRTGVVEAVLDLTELVPPETLAESGAVLNGIAYRPATDTFFITGKNWPVMYELRLNAPG